MLPGTGGLTRVVDKRHVRRDLADYFATKSEGLGGQKAAAWNLVDEVVPRPAWDRAVAERAAELVKRGVRFLAVMSDLAMLRAGAAAALKILNA